MANKLFPYRVRGNVLAAPLVTYGASTPSGVTFNGQALTKLAQASRLHLANTWAIEFWALESPAVAEGYVEVSSLASDYVVFPMSLSNVDLSDAFPNIYVNQTDVGQAVSSGTFTPPKFSYILSFYACLGAASAWTPDPSCYSFAPTKDVAGGAFRCGFSRRQVFEPHAMSLTHTTNAASGPVLGLNAVVKPLAKGISVPGVAFGRGDMAPYITQAPQQAPVLTATAGLAPGSVDMTWTGSEPSQASNPETYTVQLSEDDSFAFVAATVSNIKSLGLAGRLLASAGSNVSGRVRKDNRIGSGPWSNTVTVLTAIVQEVPDPVTLATPSNVDHEGYTLDVVDTNVGAKAVTAYRYERMTAASGGTVAETRTANPASSAIVVTGASAETDYFWRVIGINGAGESTPSAVVTVTTAASPQAPTAPAWLSPAVSNTQNGSVIIEHRWEFPNGDVFTAEDQYLEEYADAARTDKRWDSGILDDAARSASRSIATEDGRYIFHRSATTGFPDVFTDPLLVIGSGYDLSAGYTGPTVSGFVEAEGASVTFTPAGTQAIVVTHNRESAGDRPISALSFTGQTPTATKLVEANGFDGGNTSRTQIWHLTGLTAGVQMTITGVFTGTASDDVRMSAMDVSVPVTAADTFVTEGREGRPATLISADAQTLVLTAMTGGTSMGTVTVEGTHQTVLTQGSDTNMRRLVTTRPCAQACLSAQQFERSSSADDVGMVSVGLVAA